MAATFGSRRVVLCPLVASKQRRCGHAALSIADVIDARAEAPRPRPSDLAVRAPLLINAVAGQTHKRRKSQK